jgi:superfamily II DNA or RNA helicase
MDYSPGTLVTLRERDWVVMPSGDPELLLLKPLGGSELETTGIFLPLQLPDDQPQPARFPLPGPEDLGDITSARLLQEATRLAFRNGAGPFRSLAKLAFRPRSYQMVPLIMALRQPQVRLLIADDVGVGKTIEALLIIGELLERRHIERFAVICLPHLCDQWQAEIKDKLGIEAVVIRSNTPARLDREIHGDVSVYRYYPYQIISIDFIKSESRREVFINECPEMVVVDEAHSCARPLGASRAQQQRHALIHDIAAKPGQHLVMLTATPHSGKPEEFLSLLGLLRPEFETLDLPNSSQRQRRALARHFVQRRRADVEKWMDEDTPFPRRDPGEFDYPLSSAYAAFFERLLAFTSRLLATDEPASAIDPAAHQDPQPRQRFRYWTALGLLRGVMSSPAAGIAMLENRIRKLPSGPGTSGQAPQEQPRSNPVHDLDYGFDSDLPPVELVELNDWSKRQREQLRGFAKELAQLGNPKDDLKLAHAELILDDWLADGYNAVVFCKYIPSAKYLGERLAPLLKRNHPKLDIQVITSEDPDDLRRQRIEAMAGSPQRLLIATDCLSEGINLQQYFTAVLHYDLPWNPNRLEQREGRVDRFGQTAKLVKAYLLYGKDNPIDGVVLDVILRKVREIRRATGINIPFPEDSKSIIDTITQALLLNPKRRGSGAMEQKQMQLDLDAAGGADRIRLETSDKLARAAERETISRSIFAQNAIKAHEIEADLKETDAAIGNPDAVEQFVTQSLPVLLGVQVDAAGPDLPQCYTLYGTNLPPQLRELLPGSHAATRHARRPGTGPDNGQTETAISFASPTPPGYHYLGRNHPFVENLCQWVMANTIERRGKRAARAAVIRSNAVTVKTTLMLFRVRNVIGEQNRANNGAHQLVAEEVLLWGYRGAAAARDFLSPERATDLLHHARPSANRSAQANAATLEHELAQWETLADDLDRIAEQRAAHLVEAHERFGRFVERRHYQVVYPVLPMDLLGIYILLPGDKG